MIFAEIGYVKHCGWVQKILGVGTKKGAGLNGGTRYTFTGRGKKCTVYHCIRAVCLAMTHS